MTLDYFALLLASGPEAVKLPLAMLVVFASAKILDELFERYHQPGIVGQILAGVVIGRPSVLGWMVPNDFLATLELGVMFLLFRVGLEVKASDLIKVGWGLLRLWGEPQIKSIFVGAAMVATSIGITRDYNYMINSAPVADEGEEYYLWHFQILPRLTSLAGFELGSGMRINPVRPEDTAHSLRAISVAV